MQTPGSKLLLGLAGVLFAFASARAHEEPTSFVDLRLTPDGIVAQLTASDTDLAHELPAVEPRMLLERPVIDAHRETLSALIQSRFQIRAGGERLRGELREVVPLVENRDLRFEFFYPWTAQPGVLQVESQLFPYDPRHRTFLNIYRENQLDRQEIFEGARTSIEFQSGARQGIGNVLRQFFVQGVHHIFIGPDHILFIVGLLLLGGGVGRLLQIVTAFTIAHSVTLGLATFRLVTPPAWVIEPIIALSIVFVGVSALLGKGKRDPRLFFAFGFGLIHGFGFANVLQEMTLPSEALGWSLLAFNGGVELGQACIVIAVAPFLLVLRRRNAVVAERVVVAAALCVTTAGAFWFFQRVMA